MSVIPSEQLSYASISLTYRPSRVIIVIDGGEHWSYWARRALYRANRFWAGGGFAVVPHRDGHVHPVLLRACQEFDPDFVVTYSPTIEDHEYFDPGRFQPTGEDGVLLTGDARDRAFDAARSIQIASEAESAARDEIASVCSVYRTLGEEVTTILEDGVEYFIDLTEIPGTWSGSVLGCPSDWGGLVGAAVALHAGVAEPPSRDASEPELTRQASQELTDLLLEGQGAAAPNDLLWHPGAAVGIDTRRVPSARQRTMSHLETISTRVGHGPTRLLVLGDSAEDFALACLWQRTFGTAYWLPSVLGTDQVEGPWHLGRHVARLGRKSRRFPGDLVITSVSLPDEDLKAGVESLKTANPMISAAWSEREAGRLDMPSSPQQPASDPLVVIPCSEISWNQPATIFLAVCGQWDIFVTVPVTIDETGTTKMAAPLPPPTINHELTAIGGIDWHVDVRWSKARTTRYASGSTPPCAHG